MAKSLLLSGDKLTLPNARIKRWMSAKSSDPTSRQAWCLPGASGLVGGCLTWPQGGWMLDQATQTLVRTRCQPSLVGLILSVPQTF